VRILQVPEEEKRGGRGHPAAPEVHADAGLPEVVTIDWDSGGGWIIYIRLIYLICIFF
jgi:hypothetical protein